MHLLVLLAQLVLQQVIASMLTLQVSLLLQVSAVMLAMQVPPQQVASPVLAQALQQVLRQVSTPMTSQVTAALALQSPMVILGLLSSLVVVVFEEQVRAKISCRSASFTGKSPSGVSSRPTGQYFEINEHITITMVKTYKL